MIKLLFNFNKVWRLARTVETVLERCLKDKDWTPTPKEWEQIIDALIPLIGNVINIPGADKLHITQSLIEKKQELQSA